MQYAHTTFPYQSLKFCSKVAYAIRTYNVPIIRHVETSTLALLFIVAAIFGGLHLLLIHVRALVPAAKKKNRRISERLIWHYLGVLYTYGTHTHTHTHTHAHAH